MDLNDWWLEEYSKYQVIISGLDNIGARYTLNYISIALGIPLIDCGSLGWLGNTKTHLPKQTECYKCGNFQYPKQIIESAKVEVTCTIHNNPKNLYECCLYAQSVLQNYFLETLRKEDDLKQVFDQFFITNINNLAVDKNSLRFIEYNYSSSQYSKKKL